MIDLTPDRDPCEPQIYLLLFPWQWRFRWGKLWPKPSYAIFRYWDIGPIHYRILAHESPPRWARMEIVPERNWPRGQEDTPK